MANFSATKGSGGGTGGGCLLNRAYRLTGKSKAPCIHDTGRFQWVCDQQVLDRILGASGLVVSSNQVLPAVLVTNDDRQGTSDAYETIIEDGTGWRVYGTRYERNPRLRAQVLQIYGLICKGCDFDFEKVYGPHGHGFIHAHHLNPIATTGGILAVNPHRDMTVLCANCYSMMHRFPKKILALEELQALIRTHGGLQQVHQQEVDL